MTRFWIERVVFILLTLFFPFSLQADAAPKLNAEIGGDFTLTDHNGNKFQLKDYRGKLVLIFFGYTYCPDICPTELSSIAKLLKSLKNDSSKVKALFISIDPERDTVEKLKGYVPFFSTELIGLTGTVKEINQVADAYHIQRKIQSHEKSSKSYFVDHSANLFVLGGDGKIIHIVPFGLPIEHIHKIIKEEIKNIPG